TPAAHAPTADAHSNSATEAVGNAPYKLQEGANKAASGDALHSHDGVGGGVPPLLATDIDFPVLLLRLSQLNALVGAGKAHIVKRGGVHKFETPVGTPFTLYANGFMLNRGPFEPYDSKRGRAFIQDILDGYFPSELQALHPSGLLLTVIDKSELTYQESSAAAATAAAVVSPSAVAAAAALGGASRAAVAIHSLAAVGEPDMPMGLREFLSALPARVVSPQGQVVDVRAGIASMLSEEEASSGGAPSAGGLGSNIVVADTAAECTAVEEEGSLVQTFSTLQVCGCSHNAPCVLLWTYCVCNTRAHCVRHDLCRSNRRTGSKRCSSSCPARQQWAMCVAWWIDTARAWGRMSCGPRIPVACWTTRQRRWPRRDSLRAAFSTSALSQRPEYARA
ncbi:MAG: hypothetical protein EOO41_00615, partial [Methanobacteriota archaeon]